MFLVISSLWPVITYASLAARRHHDFHTRGGLNGRHLAYPLCLNNNASSWDQLFPTIELEKPGVTEVALTLDQGLGTTMPDHSSQGPTSTEMSVTIANGVPFSSSYSQGTVIPSSRTGVSSVATPFPNTTSHKRGISYNSPDLAQVFEPYVTWMYDWGFSGSSSPGVEYIPMLWDLNNQDAFAATIARSAAALSFNEPDLSSQANIDPVVAAQAHRKVFGPWFGKVRIGSPAVTNGQGDDPPMGTVWLEQFFQACSQCPVDYVAFHWYGGPDLDALRRHIDAVAQVAARHGVSELWLTEFGVTGDIQTQASFMSAAVHELESNAAIGRYAAFMASDGTLMTGNALNVVGQAYVA